jgi:hypothetical protein
MTDKAYLLSLPERLLRSALGLGTGVAREVGEVVLPAAIRRSQLYQNLVDATLRFVIEQVGEVEGVYKAEERLADNFLARRTAGNMIEVLGVLAFRASPVWVLAALADVCGMGRQLIPDVADARKAQGLLDKDAQFTSIDQMLDGMERTSSRMAAAINTPPLDVPGLRKELEAIREEARLLQPASLPSRVIWTPSCVFGLRAALRTRDGFTGSQNSLGASHHQLGPAAPQRAVAPQREYEVRFVPGPARVLRQLQLALDWLPAASLLRLGLDRR